MGGRLFVGVSIFVCFCSLQAADLESLHTVNLNFKLSPSLTVQLHTRTRTFEQLRTYNQFRIGPIISWQASKRLTLLGGYYQTSQNTRVIPDPYQIRRFFAGGQFRIAERRHWALDSRTVLERFISSRLTDYWRIRNRGILTVPSPIGQAFGSIELINQQGNPYGRFSGGLQWRIFKHATLSTAYEFRDAVRRPSSHVLATFLQWDAYDRSGR